MSKPLTLLTVMFLWCVALRADNWEAVKTKRITNGELSALFRDNSGSPAVLSGIDSLFNDKHASKFDAFDPDAAGASAGLNFEHIISGHRNPHNRFSPRHGKYRLLASPDGKSVMLVRRAQDSPWSVDSTLTYRLVEPHYIDFEFRCTPRDASKFGRHGYALFFFANYMNDVAKTALNFRGRAMPNAPEQWFTVDAPKGHADWNGGGNYRSDSADALRYDENVEFRLNTWSYDSPRISTPFYYGHADHGMTLILMFDRLYSKRDQMRFSLYKFKLPKHPRPAWDFQYVINQVHANEQYGFNGRLVWKKFVNAEDCRQEYLQWTRFLQADRVGQLRKLGASVFVRGEAVKEVNANGTRVTDEQLELVAAFTEMTDLSLEGTPITNAGIARLHNLQKLEWLNLYRCPVGDAGLAELKGLKKLQHLPIGGSDVTDDGLKHLAEMRQLLYLGLRHTRVTDKGLRRLAQLTNLTGLHLGETRITDASLKQLTRMQKLQRLWLDHTGVSDEGVKQLVTLRSLQELHIRDTAITNKGIKQLRQSLPRCQIHAGDE